MRAAILSGNIVVNVIEVQSLQDAPGAISGNGADIGDTWNGSAFVKPAPPPYVPQRVEMVQARIAMLRAGITEAMIDAAIASLQDGPAKTEIGIWWRTSTVVRRNSTALNTLAPIVGLNSAQIDALFIAAADVT